MPKGIAVFKQTHKDQRPLWKILTFDFTMDAFPGVTYFNPGRQVLCVMQVLNDYNAGADTIESVFLHDDAEVIAEAANDSAEGAGVGG